MRRRAHSMTTPERSTLSTCAMALAVITLLFAFPSEAHASFLSPELEDKLANFLAIFILFIVPIVLIVLFWLVHILPEKIAHKRHHPQFEAIRTLCLLSLVFGGLLWPLAWLWAYSRPVFYKMAYGRDTHHEPAIADGEVQELDAGTQDVASLRERLARLEGRVPASELNVLQADLEALEARFAGREAH